VNAVSVIIQTNEDYTIFLYVGVCDFHHLEKSDLIFLNFETKFIKQIFWYILDKILIILDNREY